MSYDTILPIGILLVQGGYQDNKDTYVLPHSRIQPPAHIMKQLWPWADKALAEVTQVSYQSISRTLLAILQVAKASFCSLEFCER